MPNLLGPVALAIGASLGAAPAFADDGIRCGEWLVAAGMREHEVAAKCGPPTAADRREVSRRCRTVIVDQWVYDRGPGDFVRTLVFEDDLLRYVDVGGRGR